MISALFMTHCISKFLGYNYHSFLQGAAKLFFFFISSLPFLLSFCCFFLCAVLFMRDRAVICDGVDHNENHGNSVILF